MTDSDVAAGEDKVMTSRHNTRSRAPNSSKSSAGLSDNIASLIFDLFDFDYYEYTSSAILGKIESSVLEEMKDLERDLKEFKKHNGERLIVGQAEIADKIQACKDILKILSEIEDTESSEDRFRKLMRIQEDGADGLHVLFSKIGKRNAAAPINETMMEINAKAPQIIDQHLDIVMNHAFSGLQNLSQVEWDDVCRNFHLMVGNRFHWDEAPDIMAVALTSQPKHPSVAVLKASDEIIIGDTRSSKTLGNY